jgi:putative type I restriction-modification system specificity determinant
MKETRFKQTEIGLIPEDWDITYIEKECKVGTGSKNTQDKEESGKYPFYVRSEKIERINTYSYNCEAVLTAGDGVGTGKVFHYVNGKFEVHQRVYIINEFSDKLDGLFFYLYFSNNFLERIKTMTAKSSVDSVRKDMINKMQIPLPLLYEQKKIASALISIDNLLLSLDKLIEKKKFIKQGAMQELLTGKKRLPGFTGEWVEKLLGEITEMNSGGTPSVNVKEYYGNEIPFLSISDMSWQGKYLRKTEKSITYLGLKNSSARIFPCGTILYAMYASIGKCSIAKIELAISQAVLGIKVNKDVLNNIYLYYHLSFIENKAKKIGQQGTQSNLSKEIVEKFKILLPSLQEQKAIAAVLSSMDREIESLEGKKAKYEQIKQGMMQQLLTGKIRLI